MYTDYTCPSLPDIADAGELAEVALAVVVGPSRASAPKLTHNITHHSSLITHSLIGVWSMVLRISAVGMFWKWTGSGSLTDAKGRVRV